MHMKTIDAMGKPCPLPVIEAKKGIRELQQQGGQVEVRVDNLTSVQNLEKMATNNDYTSTYEEITPNEFRVIIDVPQQQGPSQQKDSGLTIAIGRNTMGEGDPDLGALLMKSYIFSLTELDQPPQHLLFFNSGAFLTTQGSQALTDLQTLTQKGTSISTCGACLDFYELKDKLAIGAVTNMFAIAETMAQADKTITL